MKRFNILLLISLFLATPLFADNFAEIKNKVSEGITKGLHNVNIDIATQYDEISQCIKEKDNKCLNKLLKRGYMVNLIKWTDKNGNENVRQYYPGVEIDSINLMSRQYSSFLIEAAITGDKKILHTVYKYFKNPNSRSEQTFFAMKNLVKFYDAKYFHFLLKYAEANQIITSPEERESVQQNSNEALDIIELITYAASTNFRNEKALDILISDVLVKRDSNYIMRNLIKYWSTLPKTIYKDLDYQPVRFYVDFRYFYERLQLKRTLTLNDKCDFITDVVNYSQESKAFWYQNDNDIFVDTFKLLLDSIDIKPVETDIPIDRQSYDWNNAQFDEIIQENCPKYYYTHQNLEAVEDGQAAFNERYWLALRFTEKYGYEEARKFIPVKEISI